MGLSWKGEVDVDAARVGRLHARRSDGDQGRLRPVLRHPERRRLHRLQSARLQRGDDQRLQHRLRPELAAGRSGQRHLAAGRSVPGARRRRPVRAADRRCARRRRDSRHQLHARGSEPQAPARAALADRRAAGGGAQPRRRDRLQRLVRRPRRPQHRGSRTCPEQYYSSVTNVRDATQQSLLQQQVPNPFNIANFASLATTNPTLYQRLAGNSFFTAATVAAPDPASRLPAALRALALRQPAARRRQGPRARDHRHPPLRGGPQRQRGLCGAPGHREPDGRSRTTASRRCGRRARTRGRGGSAAAPSTNCRSAGPSRS